MKFCSRATSFLFLILLFGCDFNNSGESGSYNYRGYDEAGELLVSGTLWLHFEDTDDTQLPYKIEGTWKLQQENEADAIGPQIGKGVLVGSVNMNQEVRIGLNPNWKDNNIHLVGHFKNARFGDISGDWIYSTFIGITNRGTFEAAQRRNNRGLLN